MHIADASASAVKASSISKSIAGVRAGLDAKACHRPPPSSSLPLKRVCRAISFISCSSCRHSLSSRGRYHHWYRGGLHASSRMRCSIACGRQSAFRRLYQRDPSSLLRIAAFKLRIRAHFRIANRRIIRRGMMRRLRISSGRLLIASLLPVVGTLNNSA